MLLPYPVISCIRKAHPDLNETKRFDCLIKTNVPTSGRLLKSINGLLQLVYQVILSAGHKTFWLLHIDVLLKVFKNAVLTSIC